MSRPLVSLLLVSAAALVTACAGERAASPETAVSKPAAAAALLPRQEYRDKQVDLDLFFSAGDSFMFADLVPLSDRAWGWDSNYSYNFV